VHGQLLLDAGDVRLAQQHGQDDRRTDKEHGGGERHFATNRTVVRCAPLVPHRPSFVDTCDGAFGANRLWHWNRLSSD
jgi:hypothetical protein